MRKCLPHSSELTDLSRQANRVHALKSSAPLRSPSNEPAPLRRDSPALKTDCFEKEIPSKPGSSYPAVKISTVDVDAKPVYEPSGKLITEVDMDAGSGKCSIWTEF